MKRYQLLPIYLGSFACVLTAFTVNAQTLEATLTGVNPVLTVNGTFEDGPNTPEYSGAIQFTSTGSGSFDFETFCAQPLTSVFLGQTLTYDVTSTSFLPNADKIARLAGGYLASGQTSADAAAVQWAVWEIRNENSGTFDLTTGNVRIDTTSDLATANLGNLYLSQINSYSPASITYLTNTEYQDMIAFSPSVNPVPEPTSMGLLALSGALLLRRKRK